MLSTEAIKELLAIQDKVDLEPEEMVKSLKVVFIEGDTASSLPPYVHVFTSHLKQSLEELGAEVVDEQDAYYYVPILKVIKRIAKIIVNDILYGIEFFVVSEDERRHFIPFKVILNTLKRKRFKSNLHIFVVGENNTGNLAMERTSSFKTSSVVTILPWPKAITEESGFHEHFDTAMELFTYHMTNIVLAVSPEKWLIYNFNASHPIYPNSKESIKKHILHALVPKLVAPIRPVVFEEFHIMKDSFDYSDDQHKDAVDDLLSNSIRLEEAALYPKGKKIDDLFFRNAYYRWIGKLHLDNRNGMSYGFIARQLPITVSKVTRMDTRPTKDFWYEGETLHIALDVNGEIYSMPVPEVWVLTQRSGCNKTNMNLSKDLIKMGLRDGNLWLQPANGQKLNSSTKTSFDTKVILAHAVGNAIIASLLSYFNKKASFKDTAVSSGFSITHWHGYIREDAIPEGWFIHGWNNPHVACSSPHSAIYALFGKLSSFKQAFENDNEYRGDIHVEPHHGTNMISSSISDFFEYVTTHQDAVVLGNKYHK